MSALGLLLVNFFMVQSMWQKPQVMPLSFPEDECRGCGEPVRDWKIYTLLCSRNQVYAYTGITEPKLDSADYSKAGLRQLILKQMQKVEKFYGLEEYEDAKSGRHPASFLNVLIKPLPSATFGNIVDVLDELHICRVRYYQLMDAQPEEVAFVRDPAGGLYFGTR